MITYGMRCHDICENMEMEKVFEAVKANHVQNIQLAFAKSISNYDFATGHYSVGFARYIASLLAKNDVHVSVLGCYINPVNPIETMRQAEVARFIEHLKYARVIGADMVGTETGRFDPQQKRNPYTYTEGTYQLLLKSMREIIAAAEKLGVIVGVEGVFDHTLYCPELMKRFLDDMDSPNVEVILDSVNMIGPEDVNRQAEVIDKAFAYYGDKITMLHMKDFVFDGTNQLFRHVGEGLFQFEPLMKQLKAQKPHITMLLEDSNPERYHGDVEFLKKKFQDT